MSADNKIAEAAPRVSSKTRDLRISLKIRAKPEQLYRALTSATELCRWWLQGAETDARSAGRFRMIWPKVLHRNGGRAFPPDVAVGESEGAFVDLDPGRKVAWMWKFPRKNRVIPPLVNFFIQKGPRSCEVTVHQGGFSAAPEAQKYYEGCAEGWEDCLAKLKLYLETGRTCKAQPMSFRKLRAFRRRK